MFVYSVKSSVLKIWAIIIVALIVIILLATLLPKNNRETVEIKPDGMLYGATRLSSGDFKGIKTASDRIEFLKKFGWEVDPEVIEISEVTVPSVFDAVYTKYNELQKGEGLDLSKFRGKKIKRYTYIIKNYDYNGTVYANLLVYRDTVIGGDVCSADVNGFLHGFTKDNNIFM
ncbi:MAG: DUF4830 domain-containing protein [Oscillospiraceae bacterium]|nr:DUF4830 domain-containing protein [Oscillospiraceae bacterium]